MCSYTMFQVTLNKGHAGNVKNSFAFCMYVAQTTIDTSCEVNQHL
jgi:hypothetical protein